MNITKEYNNLHKWIAYHKPKTAECENCFTQNVRLEAANLSGEYKRDINDFVWLCVPCHRAIDNVAGKNIVTADKKREGLCTNGHDQQEVGVYKYKQSPNKLGKFQRKCKKCQSDASRRWYVNRKLEPEEE